jgi:hypothetical protein
MLIAQYVRNVYVSSIKPKFLKISLLDEIDIWICYTYNNELQLDCMDCLEYYFFVIYGCLKVLPKLVV